MRARYEEPSLGAGSVFPFDPAAPGDVAGSHFPAAAASAPLPRPHPL